MVQVGAEAGAWPPVQSQKVGGQVFWVIPVIDRCSLKVLSHSQQKPGPTACSCETKTGCQSLEGSEGLKGDISFFVPALCSMQD